MFGFCAVRLQRSSSQEALFILEVRFGKLNWTARFGHIGRRGIRYSRAETTAGGTPVDQSIWIRAIPHVVLSGCSPGFPRSSVRGGFRRVLHESSANRKRGSRRSER